MRRPLTESAVEETAVNWLDSVDWQRRNGVDISPPEVATEGEPYEQAVLPWRLRGTLARLNPQLAEQAGQDAFRRLTRTEGAGLVQRSAAFVACSSQTLHSGTALSKNTQGNE